MMESIWKEKQFGNTRCQIILRSYYDWIEDEYINYFVLKIVNGEEHEFTTFITKWKNLVRTFHKKLHHIPKQIRNAILGMYGSFLYQHYRHYAFI